MTTNAQKLVLSIIALSLSTGAAFAEKPYETVTLAKGVAGSIAQTNSGVLFVRYGGTNGSGSIEMAAPNARAPHGIEIKKVAIAPRNHQETRKLTYSIPTWGFRSNGDPSLPNLFSSPIDSTQQVFFPATQVDNTYFARTFDPVLVEQETGYARALFSAPYLSAITTNPNTGLAYFFANPDYGWVRLWATGGKWSRDELIPLSPQNHEKNDFQFRGTRYMFPVGESIAFTGYAHVAPKPDMTGYTDFQRVLWMTQGELGPAYPVKSPLFEDGFVRLATQRPSATGKEAPPIASVIGGKLYFLARANRQEVPTYFELSGDGTVKRLVDKYIRVGSNVSTWLFPHLLKAFPSQNPKTVLVYSDANRSLYEVHVDTQSAKLISGPDKRANPCSFFSQGMSPIEIINGRPVYMIKNVACVVDKGGVSMLDPRDSETALILAKLQNPQSVFIKDASGLRVLAVQNNDLVLMKPSGPIVK